MKICFLTTSFPRKGSDLPAPFLLEAVRSLHRKGIHVKVIATHYPGGPDYELRDGIEIFRPRYLPDPWEVLQNGKGGLPEIWKKNVFARLAIIPMVFRHWIKVIQLKNEYEILHAQWTLSGMIAWLSQPFHMRPFIVTVHGSDIFGIKNFGLARWFTRLSLRRASRVIAVSSALAREVIKFGVAPEKILIIPDGVDTSRFFPLEDPRESCILFVGSLTQNKGVHYLVEAFSKLSTSLPDCRLVLIGDGPQKEPLIDLASKLGVSEKVDFLGSRNQDEVIRWMQRAKLFVLPSLSEGLGVVLLEALACGTPVIGTNTGGIPDIITSEVGYLFKPMDVEELFLVMSKLLESEQEWSDKSIKARIRAESFAWEQIANLLTNEYQDLK